MWNCAPALLRDETYSSGVLLTNKKETFIVTLGPVTQSGSYSYAIPASVSDETIDWAAADLIFQQDLPQCSEFCKSLSGFSFKPDCNLKLSVFQSQGSPAIAREFSIVTKLDNILHQQAVLESSPFAGVNPALFIGHRLLGSVAYSDDRMHLLDSRYMEGMEGGIACLKIAGNRPGPSIGLIAGQISKDNGEGRLVAVVPWPQIMLALNTIGEYKAPGQLIDALQQAKKAGNGPRPFGEISRNFMSGVCVVQSVLKGNRKSWGSGVIVTPDTIVTNRHVVQGALNTEVWLEKYNRRQVMAVSEPLKGVDLVFLKLTKNLPSKFKPTPLATHTVAAGDPVYSVGYGLFYPKELGPVLQPLYSRGVISKQVSSSKNEGGMIVTSAHCWNGSSGGGLFNTAKELVGIMASNARDESTGEIMPDMAFVIPYQIIQQALDLLSEGEEGETSSKFQKLWRLQKTHTDSRKRLTRL